MSSIFVFCLLLIALQSASPASADSSKSWSLSDQYWTSDITILQQNNASGEIFKQGDASVTISIANLKPKFIDVVDMNIVNGLSSKNPDYVRVKPNYEVGNGAIYFATASIEVSDRSDFDPDKSRVRYYSSVTFAVSPTGNILYENPNSKAYVLNSSVDKDGTEVGLETFLRYSQKGYKFEMPSLVMQSSGVLYFNVNMYLYYNWVSVTESRGGEQIGTEAFSELSSNYSSTIINVIKNSQEITFSAPQSVPLINKLTRISFQSSSGLQVTSREKNPSVCIADRDLVHFINSGDCVIALTQTGDDSFEAAETKTFVIAVMPNQIRTTVTCVKGKISKKVTAVNPKCPTGYKKR